MNKPLSTGELAELQKEFPVEEAPAKLTRVQKLERLATLVEQYGRISRCCLSLGHNVERRNDYHLSNMPAFGALALAAQDEVFLKDGLTSGRPTFSVKDVRDYLELSTPELHEFSCDCGGAISSEKMVSRIRRLADSGPRPSIVARIANGLGLT